MDLLSSEFLLVALLLLASGAATGILAGVFGVGGGALMVPVLFEVFRLLDIPEVTAMPLAVGTSLAIIVPTSIRSYRGHLARGAVDTALLRVWAVPVVAGVAVGAALARFAPPEVFQGVFVLVAGLNAIKLISGSKRWNVADDLPTGVGLKIYGVVIGLASSLMGIGGGQVANIIMTMHGRLIHNTVATSAGIGVLVSIPGAIGYMLAGLGQPYLPADAIGYVSFLGLLLFAPTTVLTTGIGVRIAHALSRRRLEIALGVFLGLVSLRFLYAILTG